MNAPTGSQRQIRHTLYCVFILACFVILISPLAVAQSSPAGAQQDPSSPFPAQAPVAPQSSAEVSTQDSSGAFQVHVNSIPIRVVVRDAHGRPVPNLRKEDFQVFQDRKLQVISHFSIETSTATLQKVSETESGGGPAESAAPAVAFVPPARFVALLFDDAHLSFGDLMQARNAAIHFLGESLKPSDRVAVFTTSGQTQLDFTDDRDKLHDKLLQLQPRAVSAGDATGAGECPSINYYQADQMENKHDTIAISVAVEDALDCAFQGDTRQTNAAQAMADAAASRILSMGDTQTEYSLRRLKEIVRRISALPGQRSLVLISPGFLTPTRETEVSDIIDGATRANVYISTLDARGLYTVDPIGDITRPIPTTSARVAGVHDLYRVNIEERQSDVLSDLADGTGGLAFRNSNDLDKGLRMIAGAPDVSYLLAITPENFKYDGRFHSLKVTLLTKEKFAVQARRGYYAPKHSESPADAAKQEIADAVFSQEEQRSIPVELHTQYYKIDASDAKLSVMTHVAIDHIHFEKAEGRNRNKLTVIAALFDRNGNYITGNQKVIQFQLLDSTLERLDRTGVTVKSSFDVRPGAYVVRLVVQDSNAALLSTRNGAVEIPY